jgi:lipopolysaccharide export system protein LptA
MLKLLQYYIFLIIILIAMPQVQAQKGKRIKYQAEGALENGKRDGETFRKLVEDVVFTQESTTVYCDSSLFFPKRNTMEAFGHVRIVEDSTTITSRKLIYLGDERTSKLRENVIYTRGERKLFTDFLDYDLDNEIAHYFNKGRLTDSTNTLTSQIGYFYAQQNYAQFFTNVVLVAPNYTLKTDTLRYNTTTKVAYTRGPTTIINEDGTTLHAQGGEFRTVTEQSEFIEGTVETDDYELDGDELFFDDLKKYYQAKGNVVLTAKENDVIITGDEGYYDREYGISKVYGNPLMKRILKADTFYLTADTLVAIESDYDSAKRILAYHDVVFFKKGLQGIADSMAYFRSDSIIFLYDDPVIWNNTNQISADSINLEVTENEIKKMNLTKDAFMISEDTIRNYNQMKGRKMVAHFMENEIEHIDVDGNGEILYFALEKGDSVLMGMNKVFCAKMKIFFSNQEIINFRVYNKPEAKLIPPHELTDELIRLENFAWRIEERPELFDVAPYLNPDYDPEAAIVPDSVINNDSVTTYLDAAEFQKQINRKAGQELDRVSRPPVLNTTPPTEGKKENQPKLKGETLISTDNQL